MSVFQFFIPPGRQIPMKAEGFDIQITRDKEKCSISVTFDEEPEEMLSRQLGMLSKSQKAHVAIMIGVLRHGGRLAIDAEVFQTQFKEVDPDFPGITTI